MRTRRYFGIWIGFMLLILMGCSKELARDEQTAYDYVKAQGYKIISTEDEAFEYTLTKKLLYGSPESTPYQQMWGVQAVSPDDYLGKKITIYKFTVSNHPLEKKYKTDTTNVYILLSDGEVIGGTSFPIKEDGLLMGSAYSLDGRTLEEVTGLTFKEWSDDWKKRYDN